MQFTNNSANPMVVGDMLIAPGGTEEVDAWDDAKSFPPSVKAMVKGGDLVVGKPAKAAAIDDERAALFAELDKLNVTYDKKAATPDLLVVLDDAKKKAAAK